MSTNVVPAELPAQVAAALAAADIPPSKLGRARHERLTAPERTLYRWILRRFATEGRPGATTIRAEARRLGVDHEDAFAALAREDLVHLGSDGEIAVAYPFSGRSTAHRVRFESGHQAYAMCAIDALGIAPMFVQRIAIASRDPHTGEQVDVRLRPGGEGVWQPESTRVVVGALTRASESCDGCCPVVNFFASPESAEQWLAAHPDVAGHAISMTDAIAAGCAVFGHVLDDA